MMRIRGGLATWLSCICIVAAVACDARNEQARTDASTATSLDGPVPCDTMECTSGQLCARSSPGTDAGVGETSYACVTVPAGCAVFDCRDVECEPCVRELCGSVNGGFFFGVVGRTLYCPGP